jgi:hypothetical protein
MRSGFGHLWFHPSFSFLAKLVIKALLFSFSIFTLQNLLEILFLCITHNNFCRVLDMEDGVVVEVNGAGRRRRVG